MVTIKRTLSALLCTLLLATSASAAVARVSGSHAEVQYGNSASDRTLAYGGNLTSGSLLVVALISYHPLGTVTVTDGTNGSYTRAGTESVGAADAEMTVQLWYFANNAATGTPTLTVTHSSGGYISISVDEFTGIITSSPLRATSNGTAVTSATPSTGTVTATAGDLTFAALVIDAVQTASSVNSPFTLLTNLPGGSTEGIITAYHLSAAGNEACTYNLTASSPTATIIASFIPTAASGPAVGTLGSLGAGR